MSEKAFWNTLRKGMRGKWEAQRHEDAFSEGIPDVSYDMPGMFGSGWIELKYKKEFPKRENTVVTISHYTKAQRLWLYSHGRLSGKTFLFVQIKRDYFLFDWYTAAKNVGIIYKKEDFHTYSLAHWKNHIAYRDLARILSKNYILKKD